MSIKRPRSGGGWKAIAYSFRLARRVGWWKLWQAARSKNTCKTCAVGMGGRERGRPTPPVEVGLEAQQVDRPGPTGVRNAQRGAVVQPDEHERPGREERQRTERHPGRGSPAVRGRGFAAPRRREREGERVADEAHLALARGRKHDRTFHARGMVRARAGELKNVVQSPECRHNNRLTTGHVRS